MVVHGGTMEPIHLKRRSIRLAKYDYRSPGSYFVTIVTKSRYPWLGRLTADGMLLSDVGNIVDECWHEIPLHFPHVTTDAWVIMPDHVHGIVSLHDHNSGGARHPLTRQGPGEAFSRPVHGSLPTIMRSFKSAVTRRARVLSNRARDQVWQRGYHEHVIRNGSELTRIRRYIAMNPERAIQRMLAGGMLRT